MTFAVIQTGGKQYKVAEGDIITVEKLEGEHKAGDAVVFDQVLLVDDGNDTKVGEPFVNGAKVTGEFVEEGLGKKVSIVKFKSKSNYRKHTGHRQPFAKVKITALS